MISTFTAKPCTFTCHWK